jgi:muramidase (phage lysozyme)
MARLPSFTDLGRASAPSGRRVGDADVAGRAQQIITGSAGLSGKGLAALGGGLQSVGQAGLNIALQRGAEKERLDNAWLNTNLAVTLGKLDEAVKSQNDLNVLRNDMPKAYDDAYNSAISGIADEETRALFDAQHRATLEGRKLAINERARGIEKDNFLAGTMQSLEGLSDLTAKSSDPKDHARNLFQAGEFIDAARANDYISAVDADQIKNNWYKRTGHAFLGRLPPQDRIAVLSPLLKGDVASKDLQPHQRAFLNAIAGPESGGAYNVRYTPDGGASFDGFKDHPRAREVIQSGPNKGKTSDAAGRYQFLSSTWDSLPKEAKGDGSFTPENQDKAAWYLARQDYRRNTGRDLDADLQSGGFTPEIASALGSTWEGFKTSPAKGIAAYNASLKGATFDSRIAAALPVNDLTAHLDKAWKDVEMEHAKAQAAQRETLHAAREASDDAAGSYATEIYTSKNSPDIIDRIGKDARLTWETKRALVNMAQSEGVDDVEKARREGGSGYWDAYKGIIAPPGDPSRIDDPAKLFERAGPGGDLTPKGVASLMSIRSQIAKNPDAQSIHSSKVHILDAIKRKMSFDGEMLAAGFPLADEAGRENFNRKFVPAFEQSFSEWVRKGNDPWEFLQDQKRIDAIAQPFMRTKAQINAARISATGEAAGGAAKPEGVPPPPSGVEPKAWDEAMISRPNGKDGKPWPVRNWAAYLEALRKSPTPENIKEFADKHPEIDMSAILAKINPVFEEVAR